MKSLMDHNSFHHISFICRMEQSENTNKFLPIEILLFSELRRYRFTPNFKAQIPLNKIIYKFLFSD